MYRKSIVIKQASPCSATYAENVALPAFAAARRAAAAPAVQQSIDFSYPPGPQQQTRRTLLQRENGTDGQTHKQTDRQTDGHRFVDPAPQLNSRNTDKSC